jgi:hypothetical protein
MNDWVGELGTTTDGSGEFSIKGVAPGTYYLSAFLRDKDKFHSTRQKIEVGESKIDSIVLVMGGGAIIHGRMRTASGAPLPESRISVTLQAVGQEQATEYSYAQVNKDGAFEVANVADGSFTVATNSLESGWFVRSIHVGSEDIFQDGLQVEGGAVKGSLEIVLSNDGAQIEGTVTDNDKHEPLVGVVLKAKADPSTDYNYMRTQSATTDQHGHYVLKDLPPGKYRVTAKLAASGPGTAPVHSEPVFMTVGSREQRKLDFTLTLPKSE